MPVRARAQGHYELFKPTYVARGTNYASPTRWERSPARTLQEARLTSVHMVRCVVLCAIRTPARPEVSALELGSI
jgi:hypothetical protein